MIATDIFVKNVAKLLADELGEQTGELFYTLSRGKEKNEIIKEARTLLAELVGPVVAIQKLSGISDTAHEK